VKGVSLIVSLVFPFLNPWDGVFYILGKFLSLDREFSKKRKFSSDKYLTPSLNHPHAGFLFFVDDWLEGSRVGGPGFFFFPCEFSTPNSSDVLTPKLFPVPFRFEGKRASLLG